MWIYSLWFLQAHESESFSPSSTCFLLFIKTHKKEFFFHDNCLWTGRVFCFDCNLFMIHLFLFLPIWNDYQNSLYALFVSHTHKFLSSTLIYFMKPSITSTSNLMTGIRIIFVLLGSFPLFTSHLFDELFLLCVFVCHYLDNDEVICIHWLMPFCNHLGGGGSGREGGKINLWKLRRIFFGLKKLLFKSKVK